MTQPDPNTFDDPATWLPLDGLAPGFDAYRAPDSPDLAGRDIAVRHADGGVLRYRFADAQRLTLTREAAGAEPMTSEHRYEAVEVADGLYTVQALVGGAIGADDRTAHTAFLDLSASRALAVDTTVGHPGAGPACTQVFSPGVLDGAEPSGVESAPTGELIGRRVLWRYSEQHAYEHTYLTSHWYTWQCLAGPERGLADTDACSMYRLRPGLVVFTWREKVVPCAAVTVADHVGMRSHGMLFGLGSEGTSVQFTFGAHGRLLSMTNYPDDVAPA